METMKFTIPSPSAPDGCSGVIAGVLNSGNLEVMVEKSDDKENCILEASTPVKGFGEIWKAVLTDFCSDFSVGGLKFTLNDSGAVPAVVALRLRQAYETYTGKIKTHSDSTYSEMTPMQRVLSFADEGSFAEIYPPAERLASPHLGQLDMLSSLDDGVIVGDAEFDKKPIVIAAQQYGFMGGAVGEVNGAKIAGICLRAIEKKASAVILLLDSGGVRLQEANAGEIGISEIIESIMTVRRANIPVIAVVAGRNGAFGGIGIVSACADHLFISELGRAGVSGPEVIETVMGAEEYDASDRALVWRTCGGKHRSIMGFARYISSNTEDIRKAILEIILKPLSIDITSLREDNKRLSKMEEAFRECSDAYDIWEKIGVKNFKEIPSLSDTEFITLLASLKGRNP